MASRIGIIVLAFLSYASVASGLPFPLPDLQGNDPSVGELDQQRSPNISAPTNDRVLNGSEQPRSQMGNDSNKKPLVQNELGLESTKPDSGPVQEPNSKPVEKPEAPEKVQNPSGLEPAKPDSEPVQEPNPKPVEKPAAPGKVQNPSGLEPAKPDSGPVQEPNPKPVEKPAAPGKVQNPSGLEPAKPDSGPMQEPNPKPVEKPAAPGKVQNPSGLEPAKPDSGPVQEPNPKPVEELAAPGKAGLRNDFYAQSCPDAERIVNATIHKHFLLDPTYAAAFARLLFHDCFVSGCDASILLDVTPSGEPVEKKASQNGPLVRGYEVVDDIKLELEAACPGVVSCADLLAFATRDSFVYAGLGYYDVAGGRRDGLESLATDVEGNLPTSDFTAEQNIQLFQRKGLTLEELVLLVGAHSIGTAHCSVVSGRFHDAEKAKDIDRGYWLKMQTLTICQSDDQDVPFDPVSHNKMDSRFYKQLLAKKALIESDQNLANEPRANGIMKKMVDDKAGWLVKFASAMKRLGEIDVLVGDQGEVRKKCRIVNN